MFFFKDLAHVPQVCTRIQELTNLIQAEKEHMGLTSLLELTGNKCLPQWHKSTDGHAHSIFTCCTYVKPIWTFITEPSMCK